MKHGKVIVNKARLEMDLMPIIKRSFQEAGLNRHIRSGQKILIKPNLVAVPPKRICGATTPVEVSEALARHVKNKGAHPVIADSSAVGVNTEDVIQTTGYDELREKGFEVKDLKKDRTVFLSGLDGLSGFEIYETAYEADVIISLPVMKTHDQFEVSLGIKNLKGLIPDQQKKDFHRKYNLAKTLSSFLDTLLSKKPVFTLMDAIIALEGRGPVFGDPVEVGLILAGSDMVAVDSVAAMIMGFEEKELFIEKEAANRDLGILKRNKIEINGEHTFNSLPRINFERGKNIKIESSNFGAFFSDKTCTGCKNTVISCLQVIKEELDESVLSGKKVFAGEDSLDIYLHIFRESSNYGEHVINAGDDVILIGSCILKGENKKLIKKGKVTEVPGCPPETTEVLKILSTGERKDAD